MLGVLSIRWHILLLSLIVSVAPACAQIRDQRQIQWEDLNHLIGKKMRIIMPDGVLIQGRAKEVQTDALVLDIRKSGDHSKYQRGRFLVPRATLRTFFIDKPRKRGKVIGLAAGGSVGGFLATGVFSKGANLLGGYQWVLMGGMVGVPIGTYLLGRALDRRTITYVITQ